MWTFTLTSQSKSNHHRSTPKQAMRIASPSHTQDTCVCTAGSLPEQQSAYLPGYRVAPCTLRLQNRGGCLTQTATSTFSSSPRTLRHTPAPAFWEGKHLPCRPKCEHGAGRARRMPTGRASNKNTGTRRTHVLYQQYTNRVQWHCNRGSQQHSGTCHRSTPPNEPTSATHLSDRRSHE